MDDGTGDRETDERASRGDRPSVVGWKAIADELGVTERTARAWESDGMPIISWGPKQVAAYADRIRAWSARRRRRSMPVAA